jgi:Nitrous oxide-stimulated promoter
MVEIFCRGRHQTKRDLCPSCQELLDYAMLRLEKCPFQEGKTSCAKCPVYCYKPSMGQKIKEVMRYAGPRMTYLHPLLALFHFIDSSRKGPLRKGKQPNR